jgi:hypothetical protein
VANRARLLVAVLAAIVGARVYVLAASTKLLRGPSGAGFGADFGMFSGAAKAMALGLNPYIPDVLYRTEKALMHSQGLLITGHVGLVRVGNPPTFFWALQPLTRLSFQPVALFWILGMWALAGLGLLATLHYFDWRHKVVPCVLLLASPQVLTGVIVGNVVPVVLAATAGALLLEKRHPFNAGVVLTLIWLKPQIGLPATLLIVAFHSYRPRRILAGFCAGTLGALVFTLGASGWNSIVHWIQGLQGYSDSISSQIYVTSLAGTYFEWAPPLLRLFFAAAAVAAAGGLTAWWWRRSRGKLPLPVERVAWLWFGWFLATPYAHIDDELILAIPLIALLGRNGNRMADVVPAFAVFLMLFSVVRDPTWLAWELILGLGILALPDLQSGVRIPAWWKIGLFALLGMSVLPNWNAMRVDAESLELLGVAACAALFAAYGAGAAATSALYKTEMHVAVERQVSLS